MKRSTARWTTAFAAAALLTLPAGGWTQTPPPASSAAQQPPAASAPSDPQGSAQEHLRQAQAALNDISAASLTGGAKSKVADLKRHVNALQKPAGQAAKAQSTKSNWASEVAAIDKILTELLGPATTSTAGQTTGATGTAGTSGTTKSRSATTLTLDEATKTKLLEMRTHITAFAAAMSGAGATATPPAGDPPSTATPPATDPPSAATPSAPMSQPPAAPTTPAPTGVEQAQQPAAKQADPEAAKRHLTAARDTLSQLTQLPQAAQLSGEPRTQVSQLITNFNTLITATTDWRAAYDKVNANLTALIGAQPSAEPPAPAGVAGAVGTAGTMAANLDPAIQAKLVEFRNHLIQFEKVAGGGAPSAGSTDKSEPSAAPSAPAETPATPPSATPSTPATPAASASASSSTPGATGTMGSASAASTGAAGTTGAAGSATAQERPAPQKPEAPERAEAMGQSDAIRHIEAIEKILSGRSPASSTTTGSAAGATGTTGAAAGTSTASGITLDRAQLEQIRMHLTELRKVVDKK